VEGGRCSYGYGGGRLTGRRFACGVDVSSGGVFRYARCTRCRERGSHFPSRRLFGFSRHRNAAAILLILPTKSGNPDIFLQKRFSSDKAGQNMLSSYYPMCICMVLGVFSDISKSNEKRRLCCLSWMGFMGCRM